MKKALALVLALVLALSMAVSAFALDVITLEKVEPETAEKTAIKVIDFKEDSILRVFEGGTFYIALNPDIDFYDVKVNTTGNISATVVDFDEETMEFANGNTDPTDDSDLQMTYTVKEIVSGKKEDVAETTDACPTGVDDATPWGNAVDCIIEAVEEGKGLHPDSKTTYEALDLTDAEIAIHMLLNHSTTTPDFTSVDYVTAKALATALNNIYKTERFVVARDKAINIIKLVIEDNFSAAYTTGSVTIEAKLEEVEYGKKVENTYKGKIAVVNDVTIFEYEEVKWASKGHDDKVEKFLEVGVGGYSDYFTYLNGYGDTKGKYSEEALREYPAAGVVSTTAFRAIAGDDLYVVSGNFVVDIEDVAAGQKGVNFHSYEGDTYNKAGQYIPSLKKATDDYRVAKLGFGFYGDQKINGKFTVSYDLGMDWFELRETFLEKVEEDDIITYYLLKDGKLVKEYKVDYMTIGEDLYDDAVIEIELENTTLGEYELVLEVPASESGATEENPNTGAESVVGVVAALAVVSLASAAAVSLKK